MKNTLFVAALLATVLVSPLLAQVPPAPTKEQLEKVVGGMDLSMEQKFSLRSILQGMRGEGEKVLANSSLSDAQKSAQIIKLRQDALSQTQKILSAPQQKQLSALLLPN